MEEIMKCKICKFCYDIQSHEPKIIKCGHTFCLSCVKKKINDLTCPLCGIYVNYKLENSSTNFIVVEMIKFFNYQKSRDTKSSVINTINNQNGTTQNGNNCGPNGSTAYSNSSSDKKNNIVTIQNENQIYLSKFLFLNAFQNIINI
jgi:hypothetical protein